VLEMIRSALTPIGFVVSAVDKSLAAGSFHNAREAADDSSRRRAAWSGVMTAKHEDIDSASVA
jgi:hypothetical protein